MLLAMLDSAAAQVVAPVFWAALLLMGGMALAVSQRQRGRRPRAGAVMTLHTATGMVAMGALLLAMGHGDAASPPHAHGMSSATLMIVLVGGAAVYATASVVAALRAHGRLDRAQYAAMGASTCVMAMALLG